MKKISWLLLFFILSLKTFSQTTSQTVEMADGINSNGKIYLVVLVLLIIFAGIVIFLVRIDKNLSRLEKSLKEKNT
jgi:uncharacterized membrane protein